MARKPKSHDVDADTGETLVTDTPTVEMPQPVLQTVNDPVPQPHPQDDTALSTGTVAVPTMGHNQADAAEALPSPEANHASILSVVADINRHADSMERGQQRLAYLLGQRHAILTGLREAGTVKTLAELALDTEAFERYWQAVLVEFIGPLVTRDTAKTEADGRNVLTQQQWNKRCKRALELICYLSWWSVDYVAFDHDKGQFPVKPQAFVPRGYVAGVDLLMADLNAGVPRTVVYIGDDNGREPFYIGYPKGRQFPMNLSIAQFKYATDTFLRHERSQRNAGSGSVPPAEETHEPTPGRANRKAAQAGETQRSEAARAQAEADKAAAVADALAKAAKATVAANEAQAAAEVAAMTPTELGETPTTPEGEGARLHLIANIAAAAMKLENVLAHDLINTVAWGDLPIGAQNAITTAIIWFDRVKDAPAVDGEKSAAA